MRVAKAMIALMMVLPCVAKSQEKTPVQFDVITVKPHKESGGMSGWRWTSTGIEITNVSLKTMISAANSVQPWLVYGLPSWADSSRWDILAKVTDPEMKPIEKVTVKERLALIGSIAHDRFGLVEHNETKVQPVFVMTMMPDGVKFKESPPRPKGEPEPKFGRGSFLMNDGVVRAKYVKMGFLADMLSPHLERTVVDKTGLAGEYDFEFHWQPESHTKGTDDGAPASDAPPTIIEALKEQLGLKMTADKAPVPTVVVDKVEQPEAN